MDVPEIPADANYVVGNKVVSIGFKITSNGKLKMVIEVGINTSSPGVNPVIKKEKFDIDL